MRTAGVHHHQTFDAGDLVDEEIEVVPGLFVAKDRFAADGVDVGRVLVVTEAAAAPPVLFLVNGAPVEVAVTDHVAELEVTAAAPGPIVVSAGGYTVTLTAEVR